VSRLDVTSTRQGHGCASTAEHICLGHLLPVRREARGHPYPPRLLEVSFLIADCEIDLTSAAIS
jgi:hypothetical protein